SPATSKTIAAIRFEGAECAITGVQPLTGALDVLVDGGADPAVSQTLLVSSLKGALKLGSSEATLSTFKADLRLASGQTWNFL
ncbi:MAG TPA: hypothetical protein VGI76_10120, partial [Solirubrobacteraceae bacterium]